MTKSDILTAVKELEDEVGIEMPSGVADIACSVLDYFDPDCSTCRYVSYPAENPPCLNCTGTAPTENKWRAKDG